MKWKPRGEVKNEGRQQFSITKKNKKGITSTRDIWHYTCGVCGPDIWYKDKEVQMDHIIPVVDINVGFTNFDDFIDRLLSPKENWQRLCLIHHEEKSKLEGTFRTKGRKSRKK